MPVRDTSGKAAAKRAVDLALIVVLAPVTAPLCVVILLAILVEQLLSRDFGPLIISERRVSRGRLFRLYKLNMFRESARRAYMSGDRRYAEQGTSPTFRRMTIA